MSIQITCPAGHSLKVSDGWSGKAGRCPICKAMLQVPVVETVLLDNPEPQNVARPIDLSAQLTSQLVPDVLTEDENEPASVLQLLEVQSAAILTPEDGPAKAALQEHLARDERTAIHAPSRSAVPPPLPRALNNDLVSASAEIAHSAAHASEVRDEIEVLPEVATANPIATTADSQAFKQVPKKAAILQINRAATLTLPPLPPTLRPKRGYRASASQGRTAGRIATAMGLFGLLCMLPATTHYNLADAPNWARALWLLSVLQLAYAAWVRSIPDWAPLWTAMIWQTLVGAAFGSAMAIALTTPLSDAVALGMTDIRQSAPLWCAGMVALSFAIAYWSGRTAWRWQRGVRVA